MMIDQERIDAYNQRSRATLGGIAEMTPSQLDQVIAHGTKAENLLKNRDFVMFVHQFRFEVADALAGITGHTPDDNARRVALSNQLTGMDSFAATLQRAVYIKNRAVSQQEEGPRVKAPDITKEVYIP